MFGKGKTPFPVNYILKRTQKLAYFPTLFKTNVFMFVEGLLINEMCFNLSTNALMGLFLFASTSTLAQD